MTLSIRIAPIVLLAAAAVAVVLHTMRVDVAVSAEPGDDLCGAWAVVDGSAGDAARLRVRGSRLARTLAELEDGTGVLLCEERRGWHGVIVRREGVECLDRDDRSVPRPYSGPCLAGWLSDRDLRLIAG